MTSTDRHGQLPASVRDLQPLLVTRRSSDQGLLIVPHSALKVRGDWVLRLCLLNPADLRCVDRTICPDPTLCNVSFSFIVVQ